LGGDLNLVLNVEENFGGVYHSYPSRDAIENIMEKNNLIDIPPNNGKYMWNNKRVGSNNIKERLDRILVQDNIISNYNSARSRIIHTTTSYHKMVVI